MNSSLTLFILLFILLNQNSFAQSDDSIESNMGITKEMFSDINIRDAKATMEVWAKLVHESSTKVKKTKTTIYDNVDALIKSINNNEVDVVFLNSLQFISNKEKLNIQPYYGTTINKSKLFNIYLITNQKDGIKDLSKLKGKKIIVQSGRYRMINELWFDLLCLENGIKDKSKFFKQIDFVESPSKTILAVFFDKADACIAESFSYEVMVEMNPQLSAKLQIVNRRDGLINDLFCLRNNIDKTIKKEILNYGKEIDTKPKTEQVYKMFKIDGSFSFESEYFDNTIKLYNEYTKLKSNLN